MTDTVGRFSPIWHLYGYDILDARGASIGPVSSVWADNATGALKFVGFRTGWPMRTTRVIPAAGVPIDHATRTIRVPYEADRMRTAPRYDTDIPLTEQRERDVASYYAPR
jgi:hypothetical protein